MRRFLRDNAAIVIGAALPVVVVLFFVLATQLPKAYVEPPLYDVLLLSRDGGFDERRMRIDVRIEGGFLRVRAYQVDFGNPAPSYGYVPRLLLWDRETRSVRELDLELPPSDDFQNGTEVVVPELVGRRLSGNSVAPDGYVFTTAGGSSGVFGLFFDRSEPRWVLEKDGAVHRMTLPRDSYYWSVEFVGWVLE